MPEIFYFAERASKKRIKMKFKILLFLFATSLGFNSSYAHQMPQNPIVQLSQHDQEMLINVLQKLQGKKDITPEQVAQLLIEESDEEGIPLWALAITLPAGLCCLVSLLGVAVWWQFYSPDWCNPLGAIYEYYDGVRSRRMDSKTKQKGGYTDDLESQVTTD